MKAFKIVNSSHVPSYFAALSKEAAIDQARKVHHIRNFNPKSIEDVSGGAPYGVSFPDSILKGEKQGWMVVDRGQGWRIVD